MKKNKIKLLIIILPLAQLINHKQIKKIKKKAAEPIFPKKSFNLDK